jgi:hypothetical protein
MNNTIMGKGTNFFTPKTAYQYSQSNTQNFTGNKYFLAPNPTFGAELVYRVTSGTARDTARIVVTNVRGDTIRTINGPGGPGLHRAYWDLRTRPRPLGPAALRDSINAARVRRQRDDSVRAARGADTAAASDTTAPSRAAGDTTARAALRDSAIAMRARGDTAGLRALRERAQARGGFPGGGGRRGQGGGLAPGEINLRPAEGPIGGAGGGGGGGGGEGGGGFFGGGRAGNLVEPGDYLVTVNAGGQSMRQVVHVERVGEILNVDFGPDEDVDSDGDPIDP